jgi:hypothetical protein
VFGGWFLAGQGWRWRLMSFMLWYSTQGTRVSVHAIAFWSTHMVDFFFRFSFLLLLLWRWGAK